jgi:fructose-1,6-bisphosphatase I
LKSPQSTSHPKFEQQVLLFYFLLIWLGLFRLLGAEGSTNVQGETVKKLDVVANNAFKTSLSRSKTVQLMVTEEEEESIVVADSEGHYVAVFDPLVFF